jgi:hypothetical protein
VYLQAEMYAHRLKVAVVVQQTVTVLDAICADDEASHFSDCNPASPKTAIIGCRLRCEIRIQHGNDREATEPFFDPQCVRRVPGALQNLEQDQVAKQRSQFWLKRFQLADRLRRCSTEIGDPDYRQRSRR